MIKRFLIIIVLIFNLPNSSIADDIRDFQIEGMSAGDSLLDYFSKEEIDSNKYYLFEDKEWAAFNRDISHSETYGGAQFFFKDVDKKYTIYRIEGLMLYLKNINDCYEKKDKIVEEISKIISDSAKKVDKGSKPHWFDKTGNSKVSQVYFDFPNEDKIGIECYDWSDKLEEKYSDKLVVSFTLSELVNYINSQD